MYWLTDWVDKEIKNHHKKDSLAAKRGDKYRVSAGGVRNKYVKESGKSHEEVMWLIDSTVAEEFLKTESEGGDNWLIVDPGRGRLFLRKSLKYYPSGFFKEVAKDNFILWSIVFGILGGLVPMIIYIVSKGHN